MNRRHAFLAVFICTSVVSAANNWPPPKLSGVWNVLDTSAGSGSGRAVRGLEFVVITASNIIFIEDWNRIVLSAEGRTLSKGTAIGENKTNPKHLYTAKMHIPSVTVLENGQRENGISKHSIEFLVDVGRPDKLDISVDFNGPNIWIKAKRGDRRSDAQRLKQLLNNADFDCPENIQVVLKRFARSLTKSDEPDDAREPPS